jgi:DNA segregation ATPase FtsK/SpoIIIE-like protein
VAVVDGKGRLVPPGFATPHVLRVASRDEEMRYVLRSLVQLMERRDEQGIHLPRVVVLVDELADLVMSVEGAEELLVRLVQRGREAGVHMVAATQRPSAAILSGVLRANFPLRLVGRVASTHDARVAAGRGGTDAHQLTGRGDFLAVWSEVQRFQVPLVTRDDLGDLAEGKRATPALALPEVAPEANATDGVAADAARLLARAAEEGRRWRSKREAEQWLCGYSGGAAFERTGAALAWIEAQQRATTTTQAQLTASAVA